MSSWGTKGPRFHVQLYDAVPCQEVGRKQLGRPLLSSLFRVPDLDLLPSSGR